MKRSWIWVSVVLLLATACNPGSEQQPSPIVATPTTMFEQRTTAPILETINPVPIDQACEYWMLDVGTFYVGSYGAGFLVFTAHSEALESTWRTFGPTELPQAVEAASDAADRARNAATDLRSNADDAPGRAQDTTTSMAETLDLVADALVMLARAAEGNVAPFIQSQRAFLEAELAHDRLDLYVCEP